jgi:hypothetical protein
MHNAAPLSTDEQKLILALGREGRTVRQIMDVTKRSKGAVAKTLKRNVVEPRRPRQMPTHRVDRWRRTLAAEKAMKARSDPNSVARHANGNGYYDSDAPAKLITLPRLRFQEIPLSPSGGDI